MCFFVYSTEEFCDKSAKVIMDGLRNALNKLADDKKRVVMVYFMGYTRMVRFADLCNFCLGHHALIFSKFVVRFALPPPPFLNPYRF